MHQYAEAGVTEYIMPGFTLGNADGVKMGMEIFAKKVISQF